MAKQRGNGFLLGTIFLGAFLLLARKGKAAPVISPNITPEEKRALGSEISQAFNDASWMYDIPPGVLRTMADIESAFRPEIISGSVKGAAGEIGIMQITPRWHPNVNPYDPIESIWYAAEWLRDLYEQFGSWREAVAAYNWGPTNLANYGLSAAPAVTQQYVARVVANTGI